MKLAQAVVLGEASDLLLYLPQFKYSSILTYHVFVRTFLVILIF